MCVESDVAARRKLHEVVVGRGSRVGVAVGGSAATPRPGGRTWWACLVGVRGDVRCYATVTVGMRVQCTVVGSGGGREGVAVFGQEIACGAFKREMAGTRRKLGPYLRELQLPS